MAKNQKINFENIIEESIEAIFANRFSRYSKYIIQDRALPDARDGLKPVQRRILYAMNQEGNTFDKAYRKSAKTVGNVIGNYHPHGDTSVYDAMVRMSQPWKSNMPLITMHGNNGSIDGDGAAAMRYTEAKLSKICDAMLTDINKDTVAMAPNFDDTLWEPTVLPTKIPNLLINGASGISSGYATTIPPHNIYEVMNAALLYLKNPNCSISEIMKVLPGPDFPTGGIIQGNEGIKDAFQNGKGRIAIRSKIREVNKNGKTSFVITEIPYEVNKANLVRKIDEIIYDKKIDGIDEIIDETDYNGLQVTIHLKKDANSDAILNYLLKNTDLQINYNFNMIAIFNRHPKLMNIYDALKAFIEHRMEVITNRSEFELQRNEKKLHIAHGLEKAISILDEIIAIIKKSTSKSDSKKNIEKQFGFTEVQAEAIVMMQLYKLSNTDITDLKNTIQVLKNKIASLEYILQSENNKKEVIEQEIYEVINSLDIDKNSRKTRILKKAEEIIVNQEDLVKAENLMLTLSHLGYIKTSSIKSFDASDHAYSFANEDYFIINEEVNNKDNIMIFLNDGTYVYFPIYEIATGKWKDQGNHISKYVKINDGAKIIGAHIFKDLNKDDYVYGVTAKGYVTKQSIINFNTERSKNKIIFQKIRKEDELKFVKVAASNNEKKYLFLKTNGAIVKKNKIEITNMKTVGNKIDVARNEQINGFTINEDSDVVLIASNGSYLRVSQSALNKIKNNIEYKVLQNNKHNIVNFDNILMKQYILAYSSDEILVIKESELSVVDSDKLNKLLKKDITYFNVVS